MLPCFAFPLIRLLLRLHSSAQALQRFVWELRAKIASEVVDYLRNRKFYHYGEADYTS